MNLLIFGLMAKILAITIPLLSMAVPLLLVPNTAQRPRVATPRQSSSRSPIFFTSFFLIL